MKVFHLIAPGLLAGAERLVLGGTAALVSRGVSVSLGVLVESRRPALAARFSQEAARLGVPTVPIDVRGRLDLRAVWRLSRALRAEAYSVLHAHGYKALAYVLASGVGTASLVATHHGETADGRRVQLYEAAMVRLYRWTPRVVAVTETVAKSLAARGVSADRIRVIENFLPPRPSPAPPLTPPPAPDPLELVFVGRLAPEKGLDVLLTALWPLRDELWHLTVVGDGPIRAALEAQAQSLGDRVSFVGWRDDVQPYYQAAGAVMLPSRREGLPLAAIEAAAWGRPLIASAVGGVPDVIAPGETGLLVPPDNPNALTLALRTLLRDRDRLQRGAMAARARILARFSAERWALETLADYRALIDNRDPAQSRSRGARP